MINFWTRRSSLALSCAVCLAAAVPCFAQTQGRESLTKPVYRLENSNAAPATSQAVVAPVQYIVAEATTTTPTQSVPASKTKKQPVQVAQKVDNPQEVQTTALPAKSDKDVEQLAALENQGTTLTAQKAPEPVIKSEAKKTLDQATRDAKIALENLKKNVTDYRCDFIKRERIGGRLRPTEQIKLLVRNQCTGCPFSVYMRFLGPRDCKNREALYVQGENNGKMLVKEGGTRGRFLPSVWLTPTGSFATSTSRYPITQVGLVRLTERLIESAEANPCENGECKVKYISGAKVDGRVCSYLEVIRPERKPNEPLGPNNIYLAQVFLDEKMKLPIRYAAYDWPTSPGGKPRLVEEYTYRNIELNVGLCDKDFSSKNPKYKF